MDKKITLTSEERLIISNIIDKFINMVESKDDDAVYLCNLFQINANKLYKLQSKILYPEL